MKRKRNFLFTVKYSVLCRARAYCICIQLQESLQSTRQWYKLQRGHIHVHWYNSPLCSGGSTASYMQWWIYSMHHTCSGGSTACIIHAVVDLQHASYMQWWIYSIIHAVVDLQHHTGGFQRWSGRGTLRGCPIQMVGKQKLNINEKENCSLR